MIKVDIDKDSGFCFGVVHAIQQAEKRLEDKKQLYCIGDIVHNEQEIERLSKKGLKTISHEDLTHVKEKEVLLRAHGEPPSTYQLLEENSIHVIDATCPVVLRLQQHIKQAKKENPQAQIVIFGKKGHAEVNGLVGQINGEAIVIETDEDIQKIDSNREIVLFSQTTMSVEKFHHLREKLDRMGIKAIKFNDTICRQVSNRAPLLQKFVKKYDLILFVSGKKSSNGKYLYTICKQENPNTHFITSAEEVCPEWFLNCQNVGICGATSTPLWLMENIKERVLKLTSET